MKLIVGLGNPGERYARNRHNVGFMAVDRIADRHRLPAWRRKFQGELTEGDVAGERCLLLKPQTYMNESGRSVGEAARFHKIAPADIIVLHDELDLAPGRVKVKTGGGNAGHNGLRSISAHIGNDYVRVRIGIGHPGHKDQVHAYVLNDFAKTDAAWVDALLDAIADSAGRLAAGDGERFMTDVAQRLTPEEEDERKAVGKAKGKAGAPSTAGGGGPGADLAPLKSPADKTATSAAKTGSVFADKLRRLLKPGG